MGIEKPEITEVIIGPGYEVLVYLACPPKLRAGPQPSLGVVAGLVREEPPSSFPVRIDIPRGESTDFLVLVVQDVLEGDAREEEIVYADLIVERDGRF
jgi:hypothetical protein